MSRNLQILNILEHFNFHPKVSNKVLEQYCTRMKYDFLSAGEYEDHLYQYQHDERAKVIVPLILAELTKFQYIPDYIGENKRKEMKESNDNIEYAISKICEDNGIQYREVDVLLKNFAQEIGTTIENAGTRINNMATLVISTVAQDKFGNDLKISELAKWHRERAAEVAK